LFAIKLQGQSHSEERKGTDAEHDQGNQGPSCCAPIVDPVTISGDDHQLRFSKSPSRLMQLHSLVGVNISEVPQ
jgi:hypothetical protein